MARAQIGIVGGGQLARMAAQAAISLDLDLHVLAGQEGDPTTAVFAKVRRGEAVGDSLAEFIRDCQVTTFDHEGVDLETVAALERRHQIRPGTRTLRAAVDKSVQRDLLQAAGLPLPPFALVSAEADVAAFAEQHGWPLMLKTPRGGYDGRGVWQVDDPDQARTHLDAAANPLLVEPFLALQAELAVLVARRPCGDTVIYPVVQTIQERGQCREVLVPAPIEEPLVERARRLGRTIAEELDATGILAVELFVVDGHLLVNEVAARPHNTGHLTIEGCTTSQFENHLRAVLDWPLGSTDLVAPAAAMVNVLAVDQSSDPAARLPEALALGPVHVHLYGKAARAARKIGHVTVLGDTPEQAAKLARRTAEVLAAPTGPVPAPTGPVPGPRGAGA